jgi:hypothetical protein
MNTLEAHNAIVRDLVRRGLPAEYAERTTCEFVDHHRDLCEELRAAGWSESHAQAEASRRLGDARALINKTVREYQRRYWCARWPLLSFLLGPTLLLIGVSFAINMATLCIVWPLHKLGVVSGCADGIISPAERFQIYTLQAIHLFIAPATTMLILSWRARRAALSFGWIAVSASTLFLLLITIRCGIPDPIPTMFTTDGKTLPADRFLWLMSLPHSWSELVSWVNWTHVQALVPFLILVAVAIRGAQLSRRTMTQLQSC